MEGFTSLDEQGSRTRKDVPPVRSKEGWVIVARNLGEEVSAEDLKDYFEDEDPEEDDYVEDVKSEDNDRAGREEKLQPDPDVWEDDNNYDDVVLRISNILVNRDSMGYATGYAFIEYKTEREALKAIKLKHRKKFQGRELRVDFAFVRDQDRKESDRERKSLGNERRKAKKRDSRSRSPTRKDRRRAKSEDEDMD